jgi:enoyl-CoA hydratase/carnithine racemase
MSADAGPTSSVIDVRRHDGFVTEVVLNRPEALNAISSAMGREMIATFHDLAADERTRAVVVSSSNRRAFCAGVDLKERASFSDDEMLAQRPLIRDLFSAVRDLPMPSVAAVCGFALGGGFELALSCDLIVADETAVFGLPEVGVGLVPGGGGTQLLARRVGAGRAGDLILSGRHVHGPEAFRLGIVDRLLNTGRVDQVALALATSIAKNSPVAVRAAKRAVRAALGSSLGAGLAIEDTAWHAAAVSADRREGIAAFAEKRTPNWSGR